MTIKELSILMAQELDKAWEQFCQSDMMEKSFSHVGLSLNLDGSEDHKMKFQGQPPGKPASIVI